MDEVELRRAKAKADRAALIAVIAMLRARELVARDSGGRRCLPTLRGMLAEAQARCRELDC